MSTKQNTYFIDIDGTIITQDGYTIHEILCDGFDSAVGVLPNVISKFEEWWEAGHIIILTTGRPESARQMTIEQLSSLGIFCHQLIMGVGSGKRYLINNKSREGEDRTFAINLPINRGFLPETFKNI